MASMSAPPRELKLAEGTHFMSGFFTPPGGVLGVVGVVGVVGVDVGGFWPAMPGPVVSCAWVRWPSFTRAVWSGCTAAPLLPRSRPAGGAVTPEGLVGVGAGFAGVRSSSMSARVFGPNTPSAVSLLAVWY